MSLTPAETGLRQKLGIPLDARQVLVFAESSHWDPNWLRTSQEYFQLVAPGLEQMVEELRADPQRVYSIECMFFLRLFWESRPDLQDDLRELLNTRRIHLTGTGVTTPDTLLPTEEAILRDLLLGQEWLRSIGVTQEPRLAYFPDCFGHSPSLPALLNAAGFDRSAVTRIDGMWFFSADWDLPANFPKRGSSAETLLKRERCLDFTWRDASGAELLCHWNAFTYGQGDLLGYSGQARIYLYPSLARPDRSDRNVEKRVRGFIKQLAPLARTPYLFCPTGFDFNPPIPALRELLDRYNQVVYPTSGVWLVNAGMDDYFDLIEPYRDRLPTLALDPNPYWTGFYTSRPSLKQRAFRLAERLTLVEQVGLRSGQAPDLSRPWWSLAVSNHHDFITGTSPDSVAYSEQAPMLDEALSEAAKALSMLRGQAAPPPREPAAPRAGLPEYTREGEIVRVVTGQFDLSLAPQGGGTLAGLVRAGSGEPLLGGPSHALAAYLESGGLWRMGYEYRGGSFREVHPALPPASFEITAEGAYLCVRWETPLPGETITRALWIGKDDPLIYFQVEGRAPLKATLVLRHALPFRPKSLVMETAGGTVTRPPARVYRRPFWPVQRFLYLPNPAGGAGFAALFRFPGAAAVSEDGQVEVIALRNAIREKAFFNRLNLLGMPATGIERERVPFRGALAFPRAEEWKNLSAQSRGLLNAPWSIAEEQELARVTAEMVRVDSPGVFVTALKPAWRGEGIILRLSVPGYTQNTDLSHIRVRVAGIHPRQAWLCDARERDLMPLEVDGAEVIVPLKGTLTTLRIVAQAERND